MGERRWGVCAACDTCVHAAPGVGGDRDDLTIHLSAAPPVLSAIRSLIIAALSRQSFSPRNAIISRLDEGGGDWGRRGCGSQGGRNCYVFRCFNDFGPVTPLAGVNTRWRGFIRYCRDMLGLRGMEFSVIVDVARTVECVRWEK